MLQRLPIGPLALPLHPEKLRSDLFAFVQGRSLFLHVPDLFEDRQSLTIVDRRPIDQCCGKGAGAPDAAVQTAYHLAALPAQRSLVIAKLGSPSIRANAKLILSECLL